MPKLGTRTEELIYAKVTVGDLQRSYDFYTRVVGLKPTDPAKAQETLAAAPGFREVGLNQSGSPRDPAVMLIHRAGVAPDRAAASMTWIVFKTPSVAAAIQRLKDAGAEIRNAATPHDDVVFGIGFDPDGYTVEFLETPMAD
jgi:catechol 2,3-dioxygenase-like lactoylglutathione lyase family enzyme